MILILTKECAHVEEVFNLFKNVLGYKSVHIDRATYTVYENNLKYSMLIYKCL